MRRVLLLPLTIVRWLAGVIGRIAARGMKPFASRIDSSAALSNLLNGFSSSMASQRGLLLMIGSGILIVSLLAHGVVILLLVSMQSYDRSLYWLCLPATLLHVGVLVGFTGVMLATPLGQGYKDNQ